jgi:hypothetical protein
MKQIIFSSILILVFGVSALAQNEKLSCPAIKVIGGGVVWAGEPMTFTSELNNKAKFNLEYEWTVSNGTIAGGMGTPSIVVDTTGLAPTTNITATVKIKGLPENCANTASEAGSIGGCGLIAASDEYGKLSL